MAMTLISPKGTNNQAKRNQAQRLASLDGLRIGLLSNGKLNATLLLRETAAVFEQRHNCTVSGLVTKQSATKPATEDEVKELASNSDFLITANGD